MKGVIKWAIHWCRKLNRPYHLALYPFLQNREWIKQNMITKQMKFKDSNNDKQNKIEGPIVEYRFTLT